MTWKYKCPGEQKELTMGRGTNKSMEKVTISVTCQLDEIYDHLKDGPLDRHGAVTLMKPIEVEKTHQLRVGPFPGQQS